jgi:hypothetical protein
MRTLNVLVLLVLLACAVCSATRIAIPPKSVVIFYLVMEQIFLIESDCNFSRACLQEVLFMDAVQGEDNIVDIRLRFDVVGIFGPSAPKIECTVRNSLQSISCFDRSNFFCKPFS